MNFEFSDRVHTSYINTLKNKITKGHVFFYYFFFSPPNLEVKIRI